MDPSVSRAGTFARPAHTQKVGLLRVTAKDSSGKASSSTRPKKIGQAGTRKNYKIDEEVIGSPPPSKAKARRELIERYEADRLGLKPPEFIIDTYTESSKFVRKDAAFSNSGPNLKDTSLPPANIISASGVRTINFTKDELPGDWNSATKLNRKELAEAHVNFLKRNLNNTKRKSAALTNYVAPLDYQTGVSETMRRFKKELRDAGQDASSVSATIRDLSRSFSGTSTRDRPSPGAWTTQTQRKRQQKVSKEDLEALRMLDLVQM